MRSHDSIVALARSAAFHASEIAARLIDAGSDAAADACRLADDAASEHANARCASSLSDAEEAAGYAVESARLAAELGAPQLAS